MKGGEEERGGKVGGEEVEEGRGEDGRGVEGRSEGGVTYYTSHTHIQFKTYHIDTVKQPFISDMFTKVTVGHKN